MKCRLPPVSLIFLITFSSLLSSLDVIGQNLVPNWSFEILSECPSGWGAGGPTVAPPWISPTSATPDILNTCANNPVCDVPVNVNGEQIPKTGDGYAGSYYKAFNYWREYIQAPLTEPLSANTWYDVSFYVSLAENTCGVEHIGAYFSVTAPTSNTPEAIDVIPQIESTDGFISDQDGWTNIYGCFLASGGEAYITIGNFHDEENTPLDPSCDGMNSYYYIEDVMVTAGIEPEFLFIELGDPVSACFNYEIDPEITEYNLIWEDGSYGYTLVVNESGTYSVTVTDGCNFGVDSIEVTILGNIEPVDIGPQEFTLCNGDEYIIYLDPDLSEYTWQDGSHGAEYTITSAGIFSVTLDDGCGTYSDLVEITIMDPPLPVDIGNDTFLCSVDELLLTLDPALGDFIWQDGSNNADYTILADGIYSVTVSNMCGNASDEIIITELEIPEVTLGPDDQTICDGVNIEFNIDPSLGEIQWQDGSSSSFYEISSAGSYSLSITNACGTGSDEIQVFVTDLPSVDLGPDTLICDANELLLTTAAVDGSYIWQDNSINDSLLVSTSGTYSLTISNFCGTAIDSISVLFMTPLSAVDFGPDVSLCPGESLVLHADHQIANYLWQDGSTADTLLVNTSGTYYVLVSNACNSVTDTIDVVVNANPPQVALPDQLSLCQGQSITLEAGISGVSYLWSDNSQNQQLLVASPGTYSLTVSNACGADQDTVIVLDGGPAPVVVLGNDVQICAGEHMLLSPAFSNVDTWLWQDGSTLPSFDISSAGLISVAVSNACGSAFDTLLVDLLPATPSLDLGPDTSLCSWQSFTLSIQTPGVSVLWSDGSTNPDFIVSGPGDVIASITNACGTTYDTLVVVALPEIPTIDLGPDQSLCPGEIISVSPGILNVNYLWQDGSVSNTYQSTQQESIILIISNECGSSTDTLEIIESTQGPQVNLGPDIQECEGAIVTIPSGVSGVNYLWQDGSTDPDFTTTQSGVFILQVSNNCGADADTINVDISGVPPMVSLGPDTTLCEGITLLLISNADAITSVQWQDGSFSSSFTVSSPGIFSLAESNRCGDASDTIVVSYLDVPDPFSLGTDTVLCPGESITLTSPSSSFDILWQDGSTQETIIADQPITYSLQLSNTCGVVADDLMLTFDNRVPVLDLGPDLEWCDGDVFTLDATQPFAANYLWSNGSTSASIQITTPGVYSVDVSTLCSAASQDVDIISGTDCKTPEVHVDMYIPNVFSPNGDGINDVFMVSFGQDLDVTGMTGSIFDRWGNLVFFSNTNSFVWKGDFKEQMLNPGVYCYRIILTYLTSGVEQTEVLVGDVMIIR